MVGDNDANLGNFLTEVSNWDWEKFCRAENDDTYTSNQAVIFALVRACAMEELAAIKLAVNRIDGKLATPIKIELPKVYYLYPNAKEIVSEDQPTPEKAPLALIGMDRISTEVETASISDVEQGRNDLPSLSLRQTLRKMAEHPRQVPKAVIEYATQTSQWLKGNAPRPPEIPLVKSVVAAHLLALAHNRNIAALTEVFDQIDGKLVETIQLLGEDIYITDYSLTAPAHAVLNAEGIYQVEAEQATTLWGKKLQE